MPFLNIKVATGGIGFVGDAGLIYDENLDQYTIVELLDGVLVDGGNSVTLQDGGIPVGEFVAGYSPVQVREDGAGYIVLWRNVTTPNDHLYVTWDLDATGDKVGVATAVTDLATIETDFGADVNKDGVIGRVPELAIVGDSYSSYLETNFNALDDFTWSAPVNLEPTGANGASLASAIAAVVTHLSSNPKNVLLFWDGGDSLSAYDDDSTAAASMTTLMDNAGGTPAVVIGPIPQKYGGAFEQSAAEVTNLADYRTNARATVEARGGIYIDVMPLLQDPSLILDAGDQAAVTAGFTPPRFFVDDSHLDTNAHDIILPTIIAAIKSKWPDVDFSALHNPPASVEMAFFQDAMTFNGSDIYTGTGTDVFGNAVSSSFLGNISKGANGGYNMTEGTATDDYVQYNFPTLDSSSSGRHLTLIYRRNGVADSAGVLVGSNSSTRYLGAMENGITSSADLMSGSTCDSFRVKGVTIAASATRNTLWDNVGGRSGIVAVTFRNVDLHDGIARFGRFWNTVPTYHCEMEILGAVISNDNATATIDAINTWAETTATSVAS